MRYDICNFHFIRLTRLAISLVLLLTSGLTASSRPAAKAGEAFVEPRFSSRLITRVPGAPAQRSVVGTAIDTETPAGALTVTVFFSPEFISVTNLSNDNGTISADVAVTCAAPLGVRFVSLQITDGDGEIGFGAIQVRITETALRYASPQPVSFNSARMITPEAPPEGPFGLTVAAPSFRGDLSVDQTSGGVSISRARPSGNHTVTVTNVCGVAHSFTLIVANGNTEYQGAVGEPVPPGAPEPGSKGSVLLFSFFTSQGASENTRITLFNRHPTQRVLMHLFFVAEGGSVADSFTCIPPEASVTFLASEFDPGIRGFLIASAVDAVTGSPLSFNHLTGKADIWLASGHSATDVKAETFQALFPEGASLPVIAGPPTINFDGVSYSRAARTLLLTDVPNPADGNDTLLVFHRIGGDLSAGVSPIGGFRGILYPKREPESFTPFTATTTRAQFFSALSDAFPLTTPGFAQLLSGGKDWRMVFHASQELGLAGLALNRGPAKLNKNLLNPLTLTRVASLLVPVFPAPPCP
jgi:hypothetical protein